MTYKQMMDKAKEYNISAWRLLVALSVECSEERYDLKLTDEQFENVCNFVYDWVISTAATAEEVSSNLFYIIIENEEYTFDNFTDYWDEITEEINHMF